MNKEDLAKLYNTLSMVETKGNSTKIMGQCLQFIEQKMNEPEDRPVPEETM